MKIDCTIDVAIAQQNQVRNGEPAAQFQDIAVSGLQGGQSPFTAALRCQARRLVMVPRRQRHPGVVSLSGNSVSGPILSPVSLTTIGMISTWW